MLKNIDNYKFEDLFDLAEIQKLVDSMSEALNMGIVIVSPQGEWITKPSSKCYFCEKLIKNTQKGYENCKISDAVLGKPNRKGPIIQRCLSAGLMDAGISIFLKDKHIASWIIGQVRIESESTDESENIAKANELGIDSLKYCTALNNVPVMTMERFKAVTRMVNSIAVQLSELGYKNYLQKEKLREKEKRQEQLEKEKVQLGYVANHDVLTGLGSRAYFEEKIQEARADKIKPCAYVACDINNLKYTNDIFGHDKGDLVIKTAARILKEEAKDSYVIGRCGGDEINILMPGSDISEAKEYIKRVQEHCRRDRECIIPVSIAMGAHELSWKDDIYQDNIILADEDMYKDKRRVKKSQNIIKELYERLVEAGYIDEDIIAKKVDVIRAFGRYLKLDERIIERIVIAAQISDVGMINVASYRYTKNIKAYEPEERELIRKHTLISYEIAKIYPGTQRAAKIILQSRETWDGQGYPHGLKGDNILFEARLLYICTMYVIWATKSDRIIKYNEVDVLEQLKAKAGSQFDPNLVASFLEFLEKTHYSL